MARPPIVARPGSQLFGRQLNDALDYVEASGGGGGPVDLSDITQSGATTGQVARWNGAIWAPATPSGGSGDTFETVAKNLSAVNATLTYSGGNLTEVAYVNGITKTLTYSGGNLTTITLSGSTPGGIDLVKTLTYTGSDLTGIAYS
jgi:hypothetical protein